MSGTVPTQVSRVLACLADVKRSGNGWSAKCPSHEDTHASLSISAGEDGRVLLYCHAGCSVEAVCQALGITMRDLFPAPDSGDCKPTRSRFEGAYRYRDESGNELYQVVRYRNPKGFRVCRRLPGGGKEWKLGNVRRVLYRLPELLAADPSEPVFVCEGEKDADNVAALGLVATTTIGGAGKWRGGDYNRHLRYRHVVILPDHDDAGEAHAFDVAWQLNGAAASIKIVRLPGLPDKGDVSDWLVGGGTHDQLLELVEETPLHESDEPPEPAPSDDGEGASPKGKTSDLLIGLAECAELFHAPGGDGDAFATVPVGNHCETFRLNGKAFRRWLLRRYFEEEKRAPNAQAVQDALGVLVARALFDGPELSVHVRCAAFDDAFWLDLADQEWRAIKVMPAGWQLVENPPVKFVRPRGMLPLAEPRRGGSFADLRSFVNVASDEDWALLLAWLVATLKPTGPFPILVLNGEAGSAKSTTCRLLRALVDPNAAPLRSEPRESRDLYIAASNSWMCVFDNLSGIRTGLSDDLCRLATGGGFATRELYSDGDEMIFNAMRPVLLNGIDDLASRGDLADRAIVMTLPPIPEMVRRTERELWSEFESVQPTILGALLDAVSGAMMRLPTITLPSLPRMADFASWSVAAEPSLALAPGAFLQAYAGNRDARTESVIDAAAIGAPLVGLIYERHRWKGTARELLTELSTDRRSTEQDRRRHDWAKSPKAMGNALRRLAPALRAVGIDVSFRREGRASRRMIIIEQHDQNSSAPSAPSATVPGACENADSVQTVADPSADSHRLQQSADKCYSGPETPIADPAVGADGETTAPSDDLPEANDEDDSWEVEV